MKILERPILPMLLVAFGITGCTSGGQVHDLTIGERVSAPPALSAGDTTVGLEQPVTFNHREWQLSNRGRHYYSTVTVSGNVATYQDTNTPKSAGVFRVPVERKGNTLVLDFGDSYRYGVDRPVRHTTRIINPRPDGSCDRVETSGVFASGKGYRFEGECR